MSKSTEYPTNQKVSHLRRQRPSASSSGPDSRARFGALGLAALLVVAGCTGSSDGPALSAPNGDLTTTTGGSSATTRATEPVEPVSASGDAASPTSDPSAGTAIVTRPSPNPGPATDAGNWISISGLSETEIAVNWSEVEGDGVRYELHRAPWTDGFSGFGGPLGEDTVIYEGTDLDHVDTTMTAGAQYVYAVVATFADGQRTEPRWRQGDAVDDVDPPSPITGLTAQLTARGVMLSWEESSDNYRFSTYEIYRGEDGIEPTWIATSPTQTQTSFLDDEIPGGVTLTYWVIADDFHENRTEPATVEVAVS